MLQNHHLDPKTHKSQIFRRIFASGSHLPPSCPTHQASSLFWGFIGLDGNSDLCDWYFLFHLFCHIKKCPKWKQVNVNDHITYLSPTYILLKYLAIIRGFYTQSVSYAYTQVYQMYMYSNHNTVLLYWKFTIYIYISTVYHHVNDVPKICP